MKKCIVTLMMSLMTVFLISRVSFAKEVNKETKYKETDISFQYKEAQLELPKGTVEVVSMEVVEDEKLMIAAMTEENENCIIWKQKDINQWEKILDVNEVLQKRGMMYNEKNSISISESGKITVSVFENGDVNWLVF